MRATRPPMRPRPTRPSCFPASSVPSCIVKKSGRSSFCNCCVQRPRRFTAKSINATANSAVAMLGTSGVLQITTPRSVASSSATPSTPMPVRETTCSAGNWSKSCPS